MELDDLRIFVTVAELASFTRAAEQLGLAKARVSTAVQQLETSIGSRLLQRTTRTVRITPDGEQFLVRCKELLVEAEQLQAMFQPATSGLRGRLRIDLPMTLARDLVIPHLPEFLGAHPRLEVAISTTDRRVDLVQEGFDCVLRVGTLGDSDLVARPLGRLRMINVASPGYLRTHGTPRTLADLAHHRVVHYSPTLAPHADGWEYVDGDARKHTLPMQGIVTVNGTDAYQAACLCGLGMIQAPAVGARAHIASGRLVEVLPAFTAVPMPVCLLYPNRHLAPRVQAMLAWLAEVVQPWIAPDG